MNVKEWIDRVIIRYTLPVSGWIGMGLAFGGMFGLVEGWYLVMGLLWVSGIGALHGHHALAMGWYEDDACQLDNDPAEVEGP